MPFGIDLGSRMPDFSGIGASIGTGLRYVFAFFIFAIVILGGVWWYLDSKKYKYRIEIYENLGGTRYVKTGVDKAKLVNVGDGGAQVIWLKRRKCYRTAYARKMGTNLIWFAVGQDGYWYNITLGDLDAKQGMLDIEPIDRDMRYMHVAIGRNTRDRYNKVKWMEKYGQVLMLGIFLIIMLFGIYFNIVKLNEGISVSNAAAEVNRQTMELARDVLGAVDNVRSGSGIVAASFLPLLFNIKWIKSLSSLSV